jgi:hypothetical protein
MLNGLGIAVPYDTTCPNAVDSDNRIFISDPNLSPRRFTPRCPVSNVTLGGLGCSGCSNLCKCAKTMADLGYCAGCPMSGSCSLGADATAAMTPPPSIIDAAAGTAAQYIAAAGTKASARATEALAQQGAALQTISASASAGFIDTLIEKLTPYAIPVAIAGGVGVLGLLYWWKKQPQSRRR